MSLSVPLLALYLMASVVLVMGLFAATTGRMPGFLLSSAASAPARIRLSGLELVLLGMLMVLTSFVYGGDGQSIRVVLILFTWVGFAIMMLVLRLVSRRLEKQRA